MIWYDEGGYFSQKKSRSRNRNIIYDTFFFLYGLKAFWKEPSGERKTVTSDEEIFFYLSEAQLYTLSTYAYFSDQEKKDMNPNTHERVLGKQQKAENQLFELKGSFWSGNSLNEFDKRSKLAFKWDAAAA